MHVPFWISMIKIRLEVLCSLLSYGVKQKPFPPWKKTPQFSTVSFRGQQTLTFVVFIFEIRFNLQKAPLYRESHARLNLLHSATQRGKYKQARRSAHNTKRTLGKGEKRKEKHFQESGQGGNWWLDPRGRKVRLLGGNSCNFHYKILFQKRYLFS